MTFVTLRRDETRYLRATGGALLGERERTVYSLPMPESGKPNGSPTAKLLVGLVLTLAAVLLFAYYMTGQLSGLRALQSNLVDRNRKDSLQLLRVQNDLNSLALAMPDMLDAREPYPLTELTAQLERIRGDLAETVEIEDALAPAQRTADPRTPPR